ncbi:Transposon Ty3-G Gag-Pol polyprotein [Stylophora pistillata]|uniref:Transposon Ty3-G Gag-Pol polyprotein n=1 Tax=Stylophora pistillata TaxID=50429 RepID=A0A2B4R7M8_STYPI|nr:Transposon Ty3-G Gag-Pol polyprotein [Stylophora pistillata]
MLNPPGEEGGGTEGGGSEGHAPNPTKVRVLRTGKSLKIEPFKIPENPLEIGRAWREWIEDFKDEISYFEITEITDRDSELVKRSIKKKWNLHQFLEEASQREDIKQQVKDMREDFKVSKVGYRSEDSPKSGIGGRRNWKKKPPRPPNKGDSKKDEKEKGKSCSYCGKTGAHSPGRNCPAYGQQCLKCGKYNHYASCCRASTQNQERHEETKRGRIKKTTETEETSSDSDADYIYLQETAQHLHRVKKIRTDSDQDTVLIRIGDIDAFVEQDSGASANSDLTVKGEFTATLRNKNRATQSKFSVIQGKMDSPPLLSKSTLLELGMLKIEPEETLKKTNELRIKIAKTPDDGIEATLNDYSDVFQEIGCFREKNTGKKIEVKLAMESEAKPVAQKPRPVLYHLQKPLKDWLDQGVEEEIFEKVPDGEAITWCSPLVVQPKPKFTEMKSEELEFHMYKASIDMTIPNQSMKRSRRVQSPRVEDFIYRLHDCKIFTKLDLRQSYHQLTLDPSTRQVATFSTPWGNYRPQRLVFGAKSSQDVFDEAMFRIFGDIHHC